MSHTHAPHNTSKAGKALVTGIVLNLAFVILEAGVGFWQGSLALVADAGHNLSDVSSLALALLAFRLSKAKPTDRFTYGYRRSTILVALVNAVVLLVAIGVIGYGAMQRIINPKPIEGGMMAFVAGIGILINGYTAYLFMHDKEKDLNVKGAYLHMLADTLVSLGVVIAGFLIVWTDWFILDPIISLGIMVGILISTWGLLKDSLFLSLDAVPNGIELSSVKQTAKEMPGIKDIHHIHIWAISTTQNALTAHLVVENALSVAETERMKNELKEKLLHLNIHHITFETETLQSKCQESDCSLDPLMPHVHHHH